jgi:protease-4
MSRLPLCLILLVASLPLGGCVIIPGLGGGNRPALEQVTLLEAERAFTRDRFLLIDVSGTITNESENGFFGPGTTILEDVHDSLQLAREDRHLRAVIIRINSPGGGITPSDQIAEEILAFRADTGIPAVAMLMDVAASGGYYIACAADHIAALPTTLTGSIGVIVVAMDLTGLENKIGVQVAAMTSGPFKDTLSPFRSMRSDERELLQGMIDEMHARFVDRVVASRADETLTADEIRSLADGRIFTAQQALEAGLIDDIKSLPQLVEAMRRDLGLSDVRVISHRRRPGGDYNLYAQIQAPVTVELLSADPLLRQLRPGLHYLWLPGL